MVWSTRTGKEDEFKRSERYERDGALIFPDLATPHATPRGPWNWSGTGQEGAGGGRAGRAVGTQACSGYVFVPVCVSTSTCTCVSGGQSEKNKKEENVSTLI